MSKGCAPSCSAYSVLTTRTPLYPLFHSTTIEKSSRSRIGRVEEAVLVFIAVHDCSPGVCNAGLELPLFSQSGLRGSEDSARVAPSQLRAFCSRSVVRADRLLD